MFVVAALLLLLGNASPVSAQGTAFTYQGRLNDNGAPANGSYDLHFGVFAISSGGSALAGPLTNSATAVSNGLFTVTLDFGAGVFNGTPRWLEIGVRTNGPGAFTTLVPRQPITPTPYAIYTANAGAAATVTGNVAASQITGTIAAANIGAGTISSSNLAAGAAAANLNAISQSGVASGGLVLSATENPALLNAGYVRIGGTISTDDIWQQRATGAPAALSEHTAVWTGSEMIVWGGAGGGLSNTGGRYNPAGNSWTAVSTNGAPAARGYHTAVWTGSEMIVWGGATNTRWGLDTGGRYNAAGNSWTAVSTTNAPGARYRHTAVWTGSEMIVWGGQYLGGTFWGEQYLGGTFNDGGRYNPAGNSWTAVSTSGAPSARIGHTAVWTGSEMIIWGGDGNFAYLNDPFSYTPGRVMYLYQRP